MQTSNFNKLIGAMSLALVVVIASLSYLLYSNGPRVRLISFERDPNSTTQTLGTAVNVTFDRPLTNDDYSEYINFYPEVSFSAVTKTQSILITLEENLVSNAEYSLTIDPEVKDQSGKKMKSPYTKSFSTAPARFAYIERNYGIQNVESGEDAEDHIKISYIGKEPEIVYSHPNIVSFVANHSHIVASVKIDEQSQIVIIEIDNNSNIQTSGVINGAVANLSLGTYSDTALYTVIPDFDTVGSEYYEENANKISQIDLNTAESSFVTDSRGEILRAYIMQLNPAGNIGILQYRSQEFYAFSPFGDYDPILIGTYTSSFGFSEDSREIVFRENENFVVYEIGNGNTTELDLDNYEFVQLVNNGRKKYVLSANYSEGETKNNIFALYAWDEPGRIIWNNEKTRNFGVKNMSVSADENYLALNLNRSGCNFDFLFPNSACKNSRIIIASTIDNQDISIIEGLDPIWLP